MGDRIRVTATCVIDGDELEWRATGSGGPGGQHANTSDTRVEVRFDAAASRSLGPRQRTRVVEKVGPIVRATASDTRSQARNRELAQQRLVEKLRAALHVDPPRRPTRPGRAAKAARLDDKRHRARRKQDRRPPRGDDG